MNNIMSSAPRHYSPPGAWCGERDAWHFVLTRYAPTLAAFNLLWEIAQLPLYTLWYEGSPGFIAYAVLHCTAGDVMIGVGALLAALVATRAGAFSEWRWFRVGSATVIFGVLYTSFSEWMNTELLANWAYTEWMPMLPGISVGLSPLLQWVLVPPAALAFSRRFAARGSGHAPTNEKNGGRS